MGFFFYLTMTYRGHRRSDESGAHWLRYVIGQVEGGESFVPLFHTPDVDEGEGILGIKGSG